MRELVEKNEIRPEPDLVIQDELDFPLGTLRIHARDGVRRDIMGLNPSWTPWIRGFSTPRIGVAPERHSDGASYLLSPMRKGELEVVDR